MAPRALPVYSRGPYIFCAPRPGAPCDLQTLLSVSKKKKKKLALGCYTSNAPVAGVSPQVWCRGAAAGATALQRAAGRAAAVPAVPLPRARDAPSPGANLKFQAVVRVPIQVSPRP